MNRPTVGMQAVIDAVKRLLEERDGPCLVALDGRSGAVAKHWNRCSLGGRPNGTPSTSQRVRDRMAATASPPTSYDESPRG